MLSVSHLDVDGKRVRMARAGRGAPLLLLHGYPDTLQIWSALAPRLAESFEVFAFDWPGMGESEPWSGGASPFDLARRLLRLLDAWGIERATIVGHDMGGQPALALAASEPLRVARVVVMNSLVIPDERTSWEIDLLRRFRVNRFLLRHAPGIVFRRAVTTSLSPGEALPRELQSELWRHFVRREGREFIIRMCAGYEGTLPRLMGLYPGIAIQTRLIWGEHDRHFPPAHAHRLRALIPGAELRVIAGGEHWMAWSRAEDVAREIEG